MLRAPLSLTHTLAILVTVLCHAVEAQTGLFFPTEETLAQLAGPDSDPETAPGVTTLRSRPVRVDIAQLAAARAAGSGTLLLNLFGDVALSGLVERTGPTASGTGYVLSGRLDGLELGTMTLLVYDEGLVGTVRTPDGIYTIRPLGGGAHAISQIDVSGLPPGGEPLVPPPSPDADAEAPDADPFGALDADPPVAASDDGSVIDVAVFYTPAARDGARRLTGVSGITALIDLMIENSNAAYADSAVFQAIRLVTAQQVNHTEASSMRTDLHRLTDRVDGFMDEVHAVRDEHAADLVGLITAHEDFCGFAWVNPPASHGFSVTAYHCEIGGYSFAHELGHNMGLRHDRYTETCRDAVSRPGGCTAFVRNTPHPYSYGYVNQRAFQAGAAANQRWMTIMAYDWQCEDAGFPRTRSPPLQALHPDTVFFES